MSNPGKSLAILLSVFLMFPSAAEGSRFHVIKEGETIYAIARKYSVTPESILAGNNIKDPLKIKPGMKIEIRVTYTVRKGDSLYSVARKMGVSFTELLKTNGLTTASTLKIGQTLTLPATAEKSDKVPDDKTDTQMKVPVQETVQTAAKSQKTDSKPEFDKVSWPCVGDIEYLNGKFGGVSISGRSGDSVRAVAGGNVIHSEVFRGWGKVVFIRSEDGYIYGYGGYGTVTVKVGDSVRAGTAIGTLALDPREEKAILRFFVYRNGKTIDPTVAPRG